MKLLLTFAFGLASLAAQNRMTYSVVSQDSGHIALGLALRKLSVSGTFMQAPAHPDDETNALFALFALRHGPAVDRPAEQPRRRRAERNRPGAVPRHGRAAHLRAARPRTASTAPSSTSRAPSTYGYSFDPQEVIGKWGRKEIVGDYVRLMRTLRPDVVVTMNIQGRGGDRAHEATTVLVREAFRAAGDPSKYPEQIREGLRPWQPRKLYFSAGFGGPGGPGGGRGGRGGAGARRGRASSATAAAARGEADAR